MKKARKIFKQGYQFAFHYLFYFWFTILICGPVLITAILLRLYKFNARLQNLWGKGFFVLAGQKIDIQGAEIFQQGKPYLVISNHSSMMDIPAISSLVYTPSSWVLKDAMLKVPVMGIFFRLGGGIPIPRSDARTSQTRIMKSVEKIRRRMNPSILIYPEGTRSHTGQVAEFKRGFIKILKAYQMDVVPVSLIGFHDYMPVGTLITNPDARLRIVVHPLIPWQELAGLDEKDAASKMRALIASALPKELQ